MSTPLFSHKVAEIFVKTDDFCVHFEKEFKIIPFPVPKNSKKEIEKQRFAILRSSLF